MKLINQLLHVLGSFKNQPTQEGIVEAKDESPPAVAIAPAEIPSKSEHVTILLAYAGEDEKYLKVRVGSKILKIAKSRILYLQNGEEVVVTMTTRYAASRPELKLEAQQ